MVRIALAVGLVAVLFVAVTVRVFVCPSYPAPTSADAIVILGGDGNRYQAAATLAAERMAPVVVVSSERGLGRCEDRLDPARIICFTPEPFSTQGEARFVADLARENGWQHLILVTSVSQSSRARTRFERCFQGQLDVIAVTPTGLRLVRDVIYEWGATSKALVFERAC